MSIGPWSPNAQGAEEYKLMQKVIALESQLSAVTAERDALQNALLRNGFTQCDIAACNCGSWHHRYGLPERWEEIKDTLREADVLDNSVGNLPLNAIKRLVTERDARQESNRQESAAMALLLERECQDGDKLAEALGVPRTEGGSLQVQRMLNVIDALRVDAERYRWLRDANTDLNALADANWGKDGEVFSGEQLDTAIDAARGAK